MKFISYFQTFVDLALEAKAYHDDSVEFLDSITKKDLPTIRKYIWKFNTGPAEIEPSRTVILMDCTGSMGGVIDRTKQTV